MFVEPIYNPPKVIGVADPDIDPAGNIPYELLLTGIDVVVPLWTDYASEPGERDILYVCFEQPALEQDPVRIETICLPENMKPEFKIHIGPEYLLHNGPGNLWYEVYDSADNPAYSFRRTLTIDRTPVPTDLPVAEFPHAKDGYLNCETQPPMWEGVTVKIPSLTSFEVEVGDVCNIYWSAYISHNGSGLQITKARKKIEHKISTEEELRNGFVEVVAPYDIHIKPMINNASALVGYEVYRGARQVGKSIVGLVRVDRIIPGEELPCGP
ncbi:hypothetical protein [Pseudomonas frederiksbergensis]|jgi:hypothetical protein|uniref:hypothetical protein n=1 Tax=Pseudomonas frederiksbergensis TaxID=104087 RepID=UPI003D235704